MEKVQFWRQEYHERNFMRAKRLADIAAARKSKPMSNFIVHCPGVDRKGGDGVLPENQNHDCFDLRRGLQQSGKHVRERSQKFL
jgi:hypothetical protein